MLVIPVPLQTPPGSTADKVTEAAFSQKGPAAVIVASAPEVMFIVTVEVSGQVPLVV